MTTELREPPVGPTAEVPHRSRLTRGLLWAVAVLLAASAMIYQRATGPTYPLKGTVELGGQPHKFEFLRSHETTAGAPVTLTVPRDLPSLDATLHWRRFPTRDEFEPVPMEETRLRRTQDGKTEATTTYEASLPPQPAAGKVEYYVTLATADGEKRLPAEGAVVLRYKDPVPDAVLAPHVTAMILVIVVGMRAGLGAIFDPATVRRYAWVALTLMTVGGMMLGPVVQKYAFGEYWTGFPWGGDWTDNKMLAMWLAWVVACVVLGASTRPVTKIGRATVLAAAVVMTAVYLIPHSMGGSQLDYAAVEQGIDPKEAIRTGRQPAGGD